MGKLFGLTEKDYRKLQDAVARIMGLKVGPGLTVASNPGRGITLGLTPQNHPSFVQSPRKCLGKVVCRGPNDEEDFADNRYWVSVGTPSNTSNDSTAKLTISDVTPQEIICVTNLSEENEETHTVLPGTPLVFWSRLDRGNPARVRYFSAYIDTQPGNRQPCPIDDSSSSASSVSDSSDGDPSDSTPSSNGSSNDSDGSDGSGGSDDPSGSNPSSQGSGSEDEPKQCVYVWNSTYDCGAAAWSAVTEEIATCRNPAGLTFDTWEVGANCLATYRKLGGSCTTDGNCQNNWPTAPAVPTLDPPPDCCGSSDGSSGGSGGSGGSNGSEKSTAIVPASFSPTGYAALFVNEAPEVRFDDVIVVKIAQKDASLPIDPRFIEVCEPGSIEVCGHSTDWPVLIGAVVEAGRVQVRFGQQVPGRKIRVTLRLTGIRKGFARVRFPSRTCEQFEANERFIRSAYPDA